MSDTGTLRAPTRWVPSAAQLRKGRTLMAKVLKRPSNLPIRVFAERAKKSTRQIILDIHSARLLSLSLGRSPTHVPDWQLIGVKRRLTRLVLMHAPNVDEWTIYYALSSPHEELRGRAAVDVVAFDNLKRIMELVLCDLGIH